jgi:hypothetical protein
MNYNFFQLLGRIFFNLENAQLPNGDNSPHLVTNLQRMRPGEDFKQNITCGLDTCTKLIYSRLNQ